MTIIQKTSHTTIVSILSITFTLAGGTSAIAGKLPADVPEYPSHPRIMVLGKAKASKEVEKAKQEAQKKKEEDALKAKEAEEAAKAAEQKKLDEDKLAEQARREIEAEKARLEAEARKEEEAKKAAEIAKAKAAEEERRAEEAEKRRLAEEARERDEAIRAAEAEKARLAEEAKRLAAQEAERARQQADLVAEKKRAEDARVAESERLQAEARRAVSRDPVRNTSVQKPVVKRQAPSVRHSTIVRKKAVDRKASVHRKRSGVSTVSKGSTNQEKQIALHDHYAKWVSSYVGGEIGRSSTADEGGTSIGVFGGKNWQSDKIVYGIEGGISNSNSSGSFAQNGSFDSGWSATVKIRGGYLVTPDTLLYATAGVAWTNFDINAGGREVSDTYAGFIIGAGLEHQFGDNWSARAEYTYTDYGSSTYQHNGQAYIFDPETHAFRVAVVYKF